MRITPPDLRPVDLTRIAVSAPPSRAFRDAPRPVFVINDPGLQAGAPMPTERVIGRFQITAADLRQVDPVPDHACVLPAVDGRRVAIAAWSTEMNANGRITPVPTRRADGP
ncbi:hypothetical protein [Stenotrophomonas sp. 22385]|uniref:hypothetical protein n=1 Tax=Stenotrophomonas sp. 22385 TaxID=3453915 RepID=UPI003F8704DF